MQENFNISNSQFVIKIIATNQIDIDLYTLIGDESLIKTNITN